MLREGDSGELLFIRYRFSVLQNEKVLQIGCMTMWVYLTVLNYTLKNCQNGGFYLKSDNCLLKAHHYAFNMIDGQPWKLGGSLEQCKLMRRAQVYLSYGGLWPLGCMKIYLECRSRKKKGGAFWKEGTFQEDQVQSLLAALGDQGLIPWQPVPPGRQRGFARASAMRVNLAQWEGTRTLEQR